MADKKQPDFVVSDRRKFTEEGELRNDSRDNAESTAAPQSNVAGSAIAEPPIAEDEAPLDPPSHAEQEAQRQEYRESGRKLDDMLAASGHAKPQDFEMSFDRLVQSMYVSALVQLGMMHREGETPRADIIGARQTIDMLGVLKDKTKGNLTDAESNLLQNALFELRMAFLEITNSITRPPAPGSEKPPIR